MVDMVRVEIRKHHIVDGLDVGPAYYFPSTRCIYIITTGNERLWRMFADNGLSIDEVIIELILHEELEAMIPIRVKREARHPIIFKMLEYVGRSKTGLNSEPNKNDLAEFTSWCMKEYLAMQKEFNIRYCQMLIKNRRKGT